MSSIFRYHLYGKNTDLQDGGLGQRRGGWKMEARKLAGHMMALCPFVLVLGLGFDTRKIVTPHVFPSYTAAQDARFAPYAALQPKEARDFDFVVWSPAQARTLADQYIQGRASGALKPLIPAYHEEIYGDGPRAEVLFNWSHLVARILSLTVDDRKAGNATALLEDSARAINLIEVLKFSDFDTLSVGDAEVTRTINRTNPCVDEGSAEAKKAYLRALSEVKRDRHQLGGLYSTLQNLALSYERRQAIAAAEQEEAEGPTLPAIASLGNVNPVTSADPDAFAALSEDNGNILERAIQDRLARAQQKEAHIVQMITDLND